MTIWFEKRWIGHDCLMDSIAQGCNTMTGNSNKDFIS